MGNLMGEALPQREVFNEDTVGAEEIRTGIVDAGEKHNVVPEFLEHRQSVKQKCGAAQGALVSA